MNPHPITPKAGKIVPHGVKPEPHEFDTYLYYTSLGEDIELIPASHTPSVKSPDIFMRGLAWEVKCPTNNQRRTIERAFYHASQQSSNIIMDLRHAKGPDEAIISMLKKHFKNTRRVRRLHIITKAGELKTYKK